jgi:hypothetical protein
MATPTQRRSYENLSRKGISRYKGSIRKKDDAVVIIGPITKLMPPHKNTQETVGEVAMYWVRSYRKSRGQWVLGMFDRSVWSPVEADKLYKQAKKFAKSVYYVPYGTMKTNGQAIRSDYDKRPSTI